MEELFYSTNHFLLLLLGMCLFMKKMQKFGIFLKALFFIEILFFEDSFDFSAIWNLVMGIVILLLFFLYIVPFIKKNRDDKV